MNSKLFLVPGLLVALGSTLSWNPEITQLARIEKIAQSWEFASETTPAEAETAGRPAAPPAAPGSTAQAPVPPPPSTAAPAQAPGSQARPEQSVRFGEIDLGEVDTQNVGTRVRYARNNDKIVYRIEGVGVCTDCIGVQTTTVSVGDLSDLTKLNRVIADHAIARLRETNPSRPGPAGGPRPNANDVETNCTQDLKDGLIACQTSELKALMEKCNNLPSKVTAQEKSACFRRVETFFRKHLQKSLQKGLNAQLNSDLYIEAKESRDELLEDLPSRYDDSIKQVLSAMTTQGVLNRAMTYNNLVQSQCQMMMGGNNQQMPQQQFQQQPMMQQPGFNGGPSLPGQFNNGGFPQQQFQNNQPVNCASYAANQAKSLLVNELQFTTGPQLRNALINSGDGDTMSLQQMYMSTFHNPLMNVWNQNSQNGINWSQAMMVTPGLQNGQIPGLQSTGPVNPGTYDARTQGQRGNGPQLPQAFGNPVGNGTPMGQPGYRPVGQSTVPTQQSYASPTAPTGLRVRQ
ncbi:MAG: hypothetical protein KF681_06165 [Bdellovibrionaceae bacterium]|nr:hypothetical protein [Pseudobdellovibrionaceae bacterium]